MNTTEKTIPGSRWWKCDLHVHTPASYDFVDSTASPEEWVQAAIGAGVEAVAVTDHNDHRWVSKVQAAAKGTGLIVFPGVEITVSGGIHLLALLDPQATGDAIAAVLGACGIRPDMFGKPEAYSPSSFLDVAEIVAKQGICLAAHADDADGLLRKLVKVAADGGTSGDRTLQDIITSQNLLGVEVDVGEATLLAYVDNTKSGYERSGGPLPLLEGSDAHRPGEIGRRFTWIKMSRPDLEGLRLALLDGPLSVRRGTRAVTNPNDCATDLIESIEIVNAKYVGRGNPFVIPLSPWLNCIIGGRGTGKSSVLEFLRIAMRREDELAQLPEQCRKEFEKYRQVSEGRQDDGLLTPNTIFRVVFRRNSSRFRIQWSQKGDVEPIEEGGQFAWEQTPGDVRSRFPIRIFSQGQIFEMAARPNALLRIIDESSSVHFDSWQMEYGQEEKRFLSLRARVRELEANTREEARLRGALDDVRRKLQVFEASEHREVLSRYQAAERQQRALEEWDKGFGEVLRHLEDLPTVLVTEELPPGVFPEDPASTSPERGVRQAISQAERTLGEIRAEIAGLGRRARHALEQVRIALESPPWSDHLASARQRFEQLRGTLAKAGAGDPSEYGRLVQERQRLETQLKDLEGRKNMIAEVQKEASSSLNRLGRLRATLSDRRREFLQEVLGTNEYVQIKVIPYGDSGDCERRLRESIGRTDDTFQDQIWSDDGKKGILQDLYHKTPPDRSTKGFLEDLGGVKTRLVKAAQGGEDPSLHGKFIAYLRKLPPEALDRIELLFPEDAVRISYRSRPGEELRPIEQGSPGQKSAAILAFLLSHGSEPLVLDQPESDLDNQLVSELIVNQLRQIKAKRQMLVVTHNPNIVVNGDAELVLPFDVKGGQTCVIDGGGLQEKAVRDEICRVMEGGREALERRYRRIRGGSDHV